MKIIAEPAWKATLPKAVLNSLSNNDRRNLDGSDDIITNPGYTELADDEICGKLEEILSRVHLTDTLRKIEDSNLSKFGPRSIAKPWKYRRESLLSYFDEKIDYDPGCFDVRSGTLRPATVKAVADNLMKTSSAGLPYLARKGLVLEQAVAQWQSQTGKYPCMLYYRTQEQLKIRNVWGFPISDTIWEQRYYMPLLSVERKWPHRTVLQGPDQFDAAVSNLLIGKGSDESVFCIDFSAYDASIQPKIAFNAFSRIASLFNADYHDEIYNLYRRFVTISILTPEGEWFGPHGVPSGSSFTNSVDSEVQFQLSGNREKCQIQGDDGLYVVKTNEIDLLRDSFKEAGLVVNDSKSEIFSDREAVCLQRYYHPDYPSRRGGLGGVYSAYRAFNRIKYLEQWTDFKKMRIDGSDFFSLRTITILENCKHHPGFEEIVKLAQSFDRKGLQFSKQGLLAYSKAQESKARAGVYNQYGLAKGIMGFETMKVLNRL